jgi:hypothetical protein
MSTEPDFLFGLILSSRVTKHFKYGRWIAVDSAITKLEKRSILNSQKCHD